MSGKSTMLGTSVVEGYVDTLLREEPDVGTKKNSPAKSNVNSHIEIQERGIPNWAKQAFQLTLFHSGELMFALPLKDIIGVVDIKGAWLLPASPKGPDWLAGAVSFEGRKVPVIEPYSLILPMPYRSIRVAEPNMRITRVFIVGEGQFAVALDAIEKVATLQAQDVVWRGAPGQRPWLRGVVRQPRCAVLDSVELAKLLAGYDIVV